MRVVPSGRTTSSMVRFPTTTSRGGGAIPSLSFAPATTLLGRDLAIGKPEVDAPVPVQDERSDVPDDPEHHDPNHELEGQGAGHRERSVHGAVEDEHEHQADQHDDPAHTGKDDRWDAEDAVPYGLVPELSA